MSVSDMRAAVHLLSAFALTILSALGLGFPITVAIIWICS